MFRKSFGFRVILSLQTLGLILVFNPNRGATSEQELVQTFTLAQGISYALNNSREFQVARKDVELASEKVKEARAAFLPRLMLDAGYTFSGSLPTIVLDGNFLESFGDLLPEDLSVGGGANSADTEPIEFELGSKHNLQGGAQATYPLFTWGQRGNIYRQAVLGKWLADQVVAAVQLDVELKVRQVFHNLLLIHAFVDVAEQSLAQVEKRYELATRTEGHRLHHAVGSDQSKCPSRQCALTANPSAEPAQAYRRKF